MGELASKQLRQARSNLTSGTGRLKDVTGSVKVAVEMSLKFCAVRNYSTFSDALVRKNLVDY